MIQFFIFESQKFPHSVEIIVQLVGWAVSSLECDMCVGVVCDVGMEMDVLPKLHDRLWLLVATTHSPPPQVNEAFAAQ